MENVTVHYNLVLSYTVFEATTAMEDLKAALNEHVDLVSDLFEKFSAELRSGFGPAVDNFIGFFHAIDWKEPWLICLLAFHFILLLTTLLSRKNVNFQLFLSLLAFSGVYLAERVNSFLGKRWQSFSSQNYFDPHGVFISVLWSGPLLVITILIVVNTLFTLCHLMVKWKKAELRHRARVGRDKQE
ncbi:transmembrane protein 18-like isoform X1 [Zingiber officinale]|uniref:transmembrane protein 18-like isoform X1 n=2 Tax=Zingiber officinale TaxID=94328 RepID=UPI001C4C61D0|nr:transmembrane protein 18-like isoform X1 [Zingiber officinale]